MNETITIPFEIWKSTLLKNDELKSENETLRKKVDWLLQASDLLIWDGEKWSIRKEVLPR